MTLDQGRGGVRHYRMSLLKIYLRAHVTQMLVDVMIAIIKNPYMPL